MQPGQEGIIKRTCWHFGPSETLSDQHGLGILRIKLRIGKGIDFKVGSAGRRRRVSSDDRLAQPKADGENINPQGNPFLIYLRSGAREKYTDANQKQNEEDLPSPKRDGRSAPIVNTRN